ncbi:MAG TPA: LysR family transcriptional regulator [Blastocatellia bacterium]|nr:LysR family transcriptional regulator [Blastocatellia bacterium]
MNLQTIDLNLLLALEALIEERNVTRAAKRVGLSQPAMSNALARLRRTFDDPLLVRTADGMTPTPAAQALISPVRSALTQLREALEEKPFFDPAASERTFHLLTSDYAEIVLLAPLLRELRSDPGSVRLRVQRPRSVFEPPSTSALAESFDLAIGFYPDALSLDARLHSEALWEEENVCIASASHRSIRGKLSLRQYAEADHVALFYKPQGPGVIDTLLAQKGYARRTIVQIPHFASVPFMVSGTDLIATIPERLARQFSRQLKLQILPVPVAMPPFRLTLLWHQRHHTDPAHRWIRGFIIETAARLKRQQ